MTGSLDGLRILLFEDEALIALDVEQVCLDAGAGTVSVVHTLDAAPAALAAADFDAAILDVMLAGKSTSSVAHQLMRDGTPFIFATGYSDRIDHLAEFENIPVVTKPYVGGAIAEALSGAIRKR
jgi:DNA-binding response OmpR family regulator